MTIIHVIDYLGGNGGVNSFVYDLSKRQACMGFNVIIVGVLQESWSKKDSIDIPDGIKAWKIGAETRVDAIFKICRLRTFIKKIAENDTVVCNLHLKLSTFVGAVATIGLSNVRCVETYHSQYLHYWLENKLLSHLIKKYICCSVTAFEEMKNRFHPPMNKLVTIPNGIGIEDIQKQALHGAAKEKHKIQIVSVGRLTIQKNFAVTAKAFSKLTGDVNYRIIGDGEEKEKIVEACKNNPKVELVGLRTRVDVLAEVSQADIVVMPSLWEGLSIFQLEAIALGCPMMISNVDSLRSVFFEPPLRSNESWRLCDWGYLIDTNNCVAYEDAMLHYIIHHQELRIKMSEKVHEISKNYDIEKTAQEYIAVYENIFGISKDT